MSFDNPQILVFLVFLVAFIPVFVIRYRKDRVKAALFAAAAPSNERKFLLGEIRLRMIMADLFFLFFLAFLVIALAGPRWGLRTVNDYRRGVDLVFAFDLSRSMDVRDVQGRTGNYDISRLEQGRQIAWELTAALPDLRIGAAIGRGRGILAVPLTFELETIFSFLYTINTQTITGTGTNLEALVDSALDAFQDAFPSRRLIVLFSDGEATAGTFSAAVERARRAGVALMTVGLGTEEGGPVPVERSRYAPDGYLLGLDGRAVISSRHSELLRYGADRTAGIYVDGASVDAAGILAGFINAVSSEARLFGQRREPNPRWRLFILAALLCLGAVRLMGFVRRSNKKKYLPVLLCLILFSSCARIQGKLLIMEANNFHSRGFYIEAITSYLRALNFAEAAPYANYGLASVFFALEENDAALERYRDAERSLDLLRRDHPELRFRIHYNRGIIFFEKGKYNEAAEAFRQALKIDGSRIEAKRNLELSLLTRTRSAPPRLAYSPEEGEEDERLSAAALILFEYLREKEQEQWRNREWVAEGEPGGLDI